MINISKKEIAVISSRSEYCQATGFLQFQWRFFRQEEMGSLKCVVVAVDGSEQSMLALEWALDNIRLCPPVGDKEGGKFVVLHVQSPPSISAGLNPGSIPFGGPTDVEVPAFTAAIEAHQKRITEAIMAHAEGIWTERNVEVEKVVVIGEPKELICETTSKLQAELLVMGSHNFGAFKRMFIGSVSNYCINNVKCPVTIVKNN